MNEELLAYTGEVGEKFTRWESRCNANTISVNTSGTAVNHLVATNIPCINGAVSSLGGEIWISREDADRTNICAEPKFENTGNIIKVGICDGFSGFKCLGWKVLKRSIIKV